LNALGVAMPQIMPESDHVEHLQLLKSPSSGDFNNCPRKEGSVAKLLLGSQQAGAQFRSEKLVESLWQLNY
jgi:hypothetical protein